MNQPAAIETLNLRKQYGDVVAVEGLSLTVPSGCIFGFLGPNGAGKSTTIGCLTGLLDPTGGEIRVLGQDMHGDTVDLKRRFGVMPETLGLFDGLYADEFLMFVAEIYGLEKTLARSRVEELLDALELSDDAGKRLDDFSAGMRKRVAFAAALVHRPELLFLDEPFESIDPAGVTMMKGWLHRIVERGGTIFMTTHVLETVERLCDRVAIIKTPGTLIWEGDVTPLRENRALTAVGSEFATLEQLYLHLLGRREKVLQWL
jgi:ABC-2 type transport system ATP-binding protein